MIMGLLSVLALLRNGFKQPDPVDYLAGAMFFAVLCILSYIEHLFWRLI